MMNKKILGTILLGTLLLVSNKMVSAKTFTATVTAYTLAYEECGKQKWDKDYGKTASMRKAVEGTTIAMSSKYKIGTKVKIEGFPWVFIVEDRGGKIKDDRIDIFMKNKKQAINFGSRKLKVTIVG